tara:strand:- start:1533 stop:2045 length:513 start_codon:yes stop_codon:yes gene_type:complete
MKTIKKGLIILLIGASTSIFAENIYIDGTVESRCSIFTDTSGFWGNPSAFKLSTLPADGGRVPVIRYDVSLASAYRAEIATPISFSSSPTLSDSTVFTGAVTVTQTSSADMSGYQAASTTPASNKRAYELTVAGSTWFSASSLALYGGGNQTPYPSGSYKGIVLATCIPL